MTTLASSTEQRTGRRPVVTDVPSGTTTGTWGMLLFIATEAATFAAFLASYFYLRFSAPGSWPPAGDKLPSLLVPSVGTGVLVVSCVPMWLSLRSARRGRRGASGLLLLVTLLMGTAFVALQGLDYSQEWPESTLSKDVYGSLFYTITGLHAVHVVIGLFMLVVLLFGVTVRPPSAGRPGAVRNVSLYWYFLAVLAVAIYCTVYLSPYL